MVNIMLLILHMNTKEYFFKIKKKRRKLSKALFLWREFLSSNIWLFKKAISLLIKKIRNVNLLGSRLLQWGILFMLTIVKIAFKSHALHINTRNIFLFVYMHILTHRELLRCSYNIYRTITYTHTCKMGSLA